MLWAFFFLNSQWNTKFSDAVLSDILNIESENAMKHNFNLKCDIFSKTVFL